MYYKKDDDMIEDSMNVDLDHAPENVYSELAHLRFQFEKLQRDHNLLANRYNKLKNSYQEVQVKNKELQLCSSYFEEMYAKEKHDKKNAELAFKRILNKMYNADKDSFVATNEVGLLSNINFSKNITLNNHRQFHMDLPYQR